MAPITTYLVSGTLFFIWDRIKERRAQRSPRSQELPEPLAFTAEQAARFTHEDAGARVFDRDVADKMGELLALRSAVQIDPGPLAGQGQVWRVVPLRPGLPTAAAVLAETRKAGAALALGSLSLIALPTGSEAPMLLVVASQASRGLAAPHGHFALIPEPSPATIAPPAPAEVVAVDAAELLNGAAQEMRVQEIANGHVIGQAT